MTNSDRKDLAKHYEKRWHESKKFIAFLLMEFLLAALAALALLKQPNLGWPLASYMTAIVTAMASIALVFNGYQAKTDIVVRSLALTGEAPRSFMEQMFGSSGGGKPKGGGKKKKDDAEDSGFDEEEI